jgi:hypothetical protein
MIKVPNHPYKLFALMTEAPMSVEDFCRVAQQRIQMRRMAEEIREKRFYEIQNTQFSEPK